MERFKERSDVFVFSCFKDKTSSRVLDLLEFFYEIERGAGKKSITIVKFGENKGTDESDGGLNRDVRADAAEFVKFEVGRFADIGDVLVERHIRRNCDTEVASMTGKGYSRISDFNASWKGGRRSCFLFQ